MIHLGIDPGKHGGLAFITETVVPANGLCVYDAMPMPLSGNEIDGTILADLVKAHQIADDVHATIELVGAMPKQGLSSTFTFGKGYGMVQGILAALGVRYELVTPQKWKGVILAGTAKDKDAAIAWCRRAYPGANLIPRGCRVPHDGIADAICLAEYGRRAFK
jgi:crossover junction endodeoxyribonuclease RuvC